MALSRGQLVRLGSFALWAVACVLPAYGSVSDRGVPAEPIAGWTCLVFGWARALELMGNGDGTFWSALFSLSAWSANLLLVACWLWARSTLTVRLVTLGLALTSLGVLKSPAHIMSGMGAGGPTTLSPAFGLAVWVASAAVLVGDAWRVRQLARTA